MADQHRAEDERWMAVALALGRRGMGKCWPNPAVGCVLVRDGRVVSRGWTQPGGRPHAEAMALQRAGAAARGATAYVSLEPCAHHGRTPPCAQALIDAGVARVVAACRDPDPRVAGQGLQRLGTAGIAVTVGVLEAAARQDHAGFLSRVEQGRPLIALKLASSLDGRIATQSGESQWITGPEARRHVHALRARYDAILVGGGTARDDDPTLTVRGMATSHQPVRIVASRRLDLPRNSRLLATLDEAPLWILHGASASADAVAFWQGAGAQLFEVADDVYGLSPDAMACALGGAGLTRVLCEGGGQLAASLLRGGLVDRLYAFTAGLAMGAEGRPGLGELGLQHLSDAPRLGLCETRVIGADTLTIWARAD